MTKWLPVFSQFFFFFFFDIFFTVHLSPQWPLLVTWPAQTAMGLWSSPECTLSKAVLLCRLSALPNMFHLRWENFWKEIRRHWGWDFPTLAFYPSFALEMVLQAELLLQQHPDCQWKSSEKSICISILYNTVIFSALRFSKHKHEQVTFLYCLLQIVQLMIGVMDVLLGIVMSIYADSIGVYSGIVFWGACFVSSFITSCSA